MTSSDCRSYDGITTGLIDSLIFICRVLSDRLEVPYGPEVKEALKDFRSDEDVTKVFWG